MEIAIPPRTFLPVLLTAVLSTASAGAADRFYAGAGFGVPVNGDAGDSLARVMFGSNYGNRWSFESGYTHYLLADLDDVSYSAGGVDLSLLGKPFVSRHVDLFVRLGYHFSWMGAETDGFSDSVSFNDFVVGGGIDVRPTARTNLRLEYVNLGGGDLLFATESAQLSFTFHFGRERAARMPAAPAETKPTPSRQAEHVERAEPSADSPTQADTEKLPGYVNQALRGWIR